MVSHIWLFATPRTVAHQAPLSTWDSPGKNTDVRCHFLLRGSSWLRDQTCVSRIGRQVLYHWAIWEAPQSLGTGEILAGGGSSQCCHRDIFSSSSLVAQRLGGSRLQPILVSFHVKGKWVNSRLENKARTLSWISDSACVYVWVLSCSVMSDSVALWTVAHQAPLSIGFFRQEYWNGLPFSDSPCYAMLSHFSRVQLCVTP